MTVDPRIGFWISLIAAIISALVASGAMFTDIIGPDKTKLVLGVLGLVNVVINSVNALLHAVPSTTNIPPADANKYLLGPVIPK